MTGHPAITVRASDLRKDDVLACGGTITTVTKRWDQRDARQLVIAELDWSVQMEWYGHQPVAISTVEAAAS